MFPRRGISGRAALKMTPNLAPQALDRQGGLGGRKRLKMQLMEAPRGQEYSDLVDCLN